MRNILVPVVDGRVDMTSGFRTPSRPTHNGVDFFSVPRGTRLPILSFDDGTVVLVQYGHRTSGNWLEILQDDGLVLTYKHFDSILVVNGQRVARGQQIGIMGMSGNATNVHVHLEMRQERQNMAGRNAFDPMPVILARMNETVREERVVEITQRPSPNHTVGRQGNVPVLIVNHITEGAFPGSVYWVLNPDSGVSYHFLVSRIGGITQCVAIENTAWANGTTNGGCRRDNKHSRLAVVRERRVNANLLSVSIGYEGRHGETRGALTKAQQAAAVWLMRHIQGEVRRIYGTTIPFTRDTVVGHVDVTPVNAPICPGERFPFDEIIGALGGSVVTHTAPAVPAPTASPPVLPASGRNFRVLIGAFDTKKEADALRDRVRLLPGREGAWTVRSGDVWQVQAASGPNLDGAERIADELRAAGVKGVIVV